MCVVHARCCQFWPGQQEISGRAALQPDRIRLVARSGRSRLLLRRRLLSFVPAFLVAAIGLHALNGLRIIAIDFTSWGVKHQRLMFWIAIALWVLLMAGFAPRHLLHVFGGE